MAVSLIRTTILYLLVVISFRIMGKKQVGELQPAELAIAIIMSELASIPMQNTDIPLLYGIIPILTLISLEIFLSVIALKSNNFRKIITGTPNIVIYNGRIVEKELYKLRYNLDDLMEELRLNGYANPKDIDFAIAETNGKLSVIPKPESTPVTPKDLNIAVSDPVGIPLPVISDGRINYSYLKMLGKDPVWLNGYLKDNKIKKVEDVLLLCVSNSQQLTFIQKKGEK